MTGEKMRPERRGSSSIITLIFLATCSVLAISFTTMSDVNLQMSVNHRDISTAQAAAEAGLCYADWLVKSYVTDVAPSTFKKDFTVSDFAATFGDFANFTSIKLDGSAVIDGGYVGSFEAFASMGISGLQLALPVISLENQISEQFVLSFRQLDGDPGKIEVFSDGSGRSADRKVQRNYLIVRQLPGLFNFALFSRESLTLNEGVTIDGYNFDASDDPLQIGTGGTGFGDISLSANSTVEGDVLVGVGADPTSVIDMGSGSSISGDSYAMDDIWQPPAVEVPQGLDQSVSQGMIEGNTTILGSGKYDGIDLGKDKVITISGDVQIYVTGDVHLGRCASIEIDQTNPNAKLTLFLGGNLSGDLSAGLNNATNDASRLTILGLDTCESFSLNNSGVVCASIYTPSANVEFHHNVEMFGSVVCRNFTQNEGANFHYDANLRDADPIGVSSPIELVSAQNSYAEF